MNSLQWVLGLLPVGRVWKASKGQHPGGILIRRVNNCSWLLLRRTFPWKTKLLALALRLSPATTLRNLISVTCVWSLIPAGQVSASGSRPQVRVETKDGLACFFQWKPNDLSRQGILRHKDAGRLQWTSVFICLTFSNVNLLIHYFEMLHCPKFQSGVSGVFQNAQLVGNVLLA